MQKHLHMLPHGKRDIGASFVVGKVIRDNPQQAKMNQQRSLMRLARKSLIKF